jgi:hypothetical protein
MVVRRGCSDGGRPALRDAAVEEEQMNRLEYTRRIRSGTRRVRNAAEAVMFLAHVARERLRLEQERRTLERRMRRIDSRLLEIAGAETKLVPVIQLANERPADPRARAAAIPAPSRRALPQGVMEVTLQY